MGVSRSLILQSTDAQIIKEGETVKKMSRSEMDREILSRVKKEMDRPRLAASVRDSLDVQPALHAKGPVALTARA